MVLYMIKPFKITQTRVEPDGSITIFFTVSKTRLDPDIKRPVTQTLETTITVPKDTVDIDKYLYLHLIQTGWING